MKEYSKKTNTVNDYHAKEQKTIYVPEFSINADIMLTSCALAQLEQEYQQRIWQRKGGDKHV